jgi:hypothetical protein
MQKNPRLYFHKDGDHIFCAKLEEQKVLEKQAKEAMAT